MLHVVGIGAHKQDLTDAARRVLPSANVVVGSARQLTVVADLVPHADQIALPSPLRPGLRSIVADHLDQNVVVLASGDPLFHGIGTVCVEEFGADAVRIIPAVSSLTQACARLGWATQSVAVVSLVTGDVADLRAQLVSGQKVVVLSKDAGSPLAVADFVVAQGFAESQLTVLADLGAPSEHLVPLDIWALPDRPEWSDLNVVALEVAGAEVASLVPGLPDTEYAHDGQLTKQDIRAVTLAHLRPRVGELLWDLGAGAGSIGIEWLRAAPGARAVAVEREPARAERINTNAQNLGVPQLDIQVADVAEAAAQLPTPDAIFIGGGLTTPGLLKTCWLRLPPGGRLVANAVTLESQAAVVDWQSELGGVLVHLHVARAKALGDFRGWQPAMPVVLWSVEKKRGLL